MNTLSAFLAENAIAIPNEKVVVSKRFVQDGEPVEWEIRRVTSKEDEDIRKSCMNRVPVPGKKRQLTPELDTSKYMGQLVAACVVFPDLTNADLQDSYHVKSADALLKAMLTPGEYAELQEKTLEINGYDETLEDLKQEAKN